MSKAVSATGTKYRSAKTWEMIMAPACAGNNICMYMCMVYASYAGIHRHRQRSPDRVQKTDEYHFAAIGFS
mgnify:CR=1 FL=1